MLLQKRSNPAPFSTIEAVVINNVNRPQLCLELIFSSEDVHMRGAMFVRMYNNIETMLPSIQDSDHRFLRP